MARMSDFHVVGDPRFAPDVPSGGGGVSQEYVDNADINVKKTTAKGHNTKYDESVIPQDMNILYVYNNPQSMYPASEQRQESVFYETGKSQSLEYFNGTAERWTNRTYKSWTPNNGLFALKWKYTDTEDPTYSNIRYHWLITSSKDKSVLFQHVEGRSVHDDVYASLYYEDQSGNKFFGLYSDTNTGYYPTQPSYPQQVERDPDYFSSPMAWYSDFYTEIIPTIWGMAYQPTLNFPIFDVTGSNFDAVNDYILHGQYINRSCAIDVITGDYYYIVNNAWVKQGTLDLNETGGTEVEANPQGTPTDTLNTIEIDGVIYDIEGGGGSGSSSEIIPITAGDDTTSRTFTFTKQPKFIKFYWQGIGWATDATLVWGQLYMTYTDHEQYVSISGNDGGLIAIAYGNDGKSITITGGNSFGAFNNSDGSGYMFVSYGGGSGGGASNLSDLSDVDLSNLSDGQILQYNSNTEKWENADNQGSLPFEFVIDPNDNGINIVYDDGGE